MSGAGFIERGPLDRRGKLFSETGDLRWWSAVDEKEKLNKLTSTVDRINENLVMRRLQNFQYSYLYNDLDVNLSSGVGDGTPEHRGVGGSSMPGQLQYSRVTNNATQNACDMAVSMMARNRPKPMFIPDGGDYQSQSKSDQLTRYCASLIDDLNLYRLMEEVIRDSTVWGTGILKLWIDWDSKRLRAERVFINELLIDDLEGVRGKPSQVHQRKFMNRDVVQAVYGKQDGDTKQETAERTKAIESAQPGKTTNGRSVADVIIVTESWRLPSCADAGDGRYIVSIENKILIDQPYARSYYPFIFWRWQTQTSGFWGRGIIQSVYKLQRQLDRLHRTIDCAQEWIAVPTIFVPKNASVSDDSLLSKDIGRVVEYWGDTPPAYTAPPAVSSEFYQWASAIEQKIYSNAGINQGMASGTKPAGIDSGEGLREVTDIAAGRFQTIGQRLEDTYTEAAELMIELSRELYGDSKETPVLVFDGKRALNRITWGEIDMDRDRYKIQVFQTSGLPMNPAGRMQKIIELSQNGVISKETMLSELNIPDVRSATDMETGTYNLVLATVDRIKRDRKYTDDLYPIPQMDLGLATHLVSQAMVLARLQGIEEETLDLLRQYLDACEALKMPPAPGVPPQPGAPPGAPPQPGPAPQQ